MVALAATGCGASTRDTIRIGFYGDCYGPFGAGREQAAAGAELPFIRRGAKPLGSRPTDGVGAVTIAGKRVELVLDCEFYGSSVSELAAARRLVEQRDVDILVTPQYVPDFAEDVYPPHQPGVAFVSTGLLPAPSYPNLFRVAPDFRQGSAGLGAYAYKTLGWRTAATLGEDDYLGWTLAAGFVAEFCSLGGSVVERRWAPPEATSWAPFVPADPAGCRRRGADAQLPAGREVVLRGIQEAPLRPLPPRGHVGDGDRAGRPHAGDHGRGLPAVRVERRPPGTRISATSGLPFPRTTGRPGDPSDIYAYDAVELALKAIAHAHGDLSDGERRLMAAMHQVRADTPTGPLTLDRTNSAVAPNFLIRVKKEKDGKLVPAHRRRRPERREDLRRLLLAIVSARQRDAARLSQGQCARLGPLIRS